jgi:DNA-binding transcriptional regulator YdaS (Cro superfamily)
MTGLDKIDVFAAIRQAVACAGGQAAFAKQIGVRRQYIGQVLNAERPVTDAILRAAGLQRVVVRANS